MIMRSIQKFVEYEQKRELNVIRILLLVSQYDRHFFFSFSK